MSKFPCRRFYRLHASRQNSGSEAPVTNLGYTFQRDATGEGKKCHPDRGVISDDKSAARKICPSLTGGARRVERPRYRSYDVIARVRCVILGSQKGNVAL